MTSCDFPHSGISTPGRAPSKCCACPSNSWGWCWHPRASWVTGGGTTWDLGLEATSTSCFPEQAFTFPVLKTRRRALVGARGAGAGGHCSLAPAAGTPCRPGGRVEKRTDGSESVSGSRCPWFTEFDGEVNLCLHGSSYKRISVVMPAACLRKEKGTFSRLNTRETPPG